MNQRKGANKGVHTKGDYRGNPVLGRKVQCVRKEYLVKNYRTPSICDVKCPNAKSKEEIVKSLQCEHLRHDKPRIPRSSFEVHFPKRMFGIYTLNKTKDRISPILSVIYRYLQV
eukprot:TRINITY_DN8407_c0_g1_i1.p2 TRINITY_DN8407_c0_g1~~TRINITY_DN8407_c0_g1_i1.p2  ORF type:complete len:114 (-),score=10.84 TRINITY_DN8407_c0_g1_i1:136-477(-)